VKDAILKIHKRHVSLKSLKINQLSFGNRNVMNQNMSHPKKNQPVQWEDEKMKINIKMN